MDRPSSPLSPGETLRMALGSRSQGWLAEHSGIKQPQVCALLKGRKRITPWVALRLAKCLDRPAEEWLSVQASWDLRQVEANAEAVVSVQETVQA